MCRKLFSFSRFSFFFGGLGGGFLLLCKLLRSQRFRGISFIKLLLFFFLFSILLCFGLIHDVSARSIQRLKGYHVPFLRLLLPGVPHLL